MIEENIEETVEVDFGIENQDFLTERTRKVAGYRLQYNDCIIYILIILNMYNHYYR